MTRLLLTYTPTSIELAEQWSEKSTSQMGFSFIYDDQIDQIRSIISASEFNREKMIGDAYSNFQKYRSDRSDWTKWNFENEDEFKIDVSHYLAFNKSKIHRNLRNHSKEYLHIQKRIHKSITISRMKIGRATVALTSVFTSLYLVSIALAVSSYFTEASSLDMAAVYIVTISAFFGLIANERALEELRKNAKAR
jgi:hypothetical protein